MIINEIKEILQTADCDCYSFDEVGLIITHNIPIEESRFNDCDNRIFTQITGLLLKNNIEYEVNSNCDIMLKNIAFVPDLQTCLSN